MTYKRRIRIYCDPKEPVGFKTHVQDLETGESIKYVTKIRVDLNLENVNEAHLTYYRVDEKGKAVVENDDLVFTTETIEDPAIDLTAYELLRRSDIEKMVKNALLTGGSRYKQYYLWRIAHALGLELHFDGDIPERGIAPFYVKPGRE